jgi:hypothetical protein
MTGPTSPRPQPTRPDPGIPERRDDPAVPCEAQPPRQPTDDEWTWVSNRLTRSHDGQRFPASTALRDLVWSAVHEHGWSLPEVGQWRIELRRYNADADNWSQMDVWRDRLGRCHGAELFTIERTAKSRSLADTRALL